MEAYENHIAKCSRPRVRTGIRARSFLWRRRPATTKQHRPIATRGRDGSGCTATDRTRADHHPTGRSPTGGSPTRRSPIGRNATGHSSTDLNPNSAAARDESGQGRSCHG